MEKKKQVCASEKLIQIQVWVPTCEKEVKRMDVSVCVATSGGAEREE